MSPTERPHRPEREGDPRARVRRHARFALGRQGFGWGLLLLLLTGAAAAAEARPFQYTAGAMGGTFSIVLYAETRAQADPAAAAAFAELQRLEGLLSAYRPESDWSEINRYAAEREVHVPDEVFEVVSRSLEYSRRSEGAFDITVGPLMRAWDFRDGTGRLAAPHVVQDARARVGYAHVRVDATRRTVRFTKAGVELDSGGIGKGYAVDRMVAVLKAHGIESALVSAAGSSIYALGSPPDQEGWRVAIGGPVAGSEDGRVVLKNASLSTSGKAGKFFRADGRVYGHVLDPRTGYPAGGFLAAVIAPHAIDSEAWTKAVLLNGRAWLARHTPHGWRTFLCEEDDRSSCSWLP